MPKRVFFLTYYFPPLGGVATIRSAKFSKYLSELGWQPVVFHAGKGNSGLSDENLAAQLPAAIKRIPVRTYEGAGLLKLLNKTKLRFFTFRALRLYPLDPQVGWLPNRWREAVREIEENGPPGVLYTSGPPFSTFLVARALQKRFGIPLVCDFRDEWTQNPAVKWVTPWHKSFARKHELDILQHADAVVTVTEPIRRLLDQDRPAGKRPVELIQNGYDEADFENIVEPKLADKFTFAIIGSVYDAGNPEPVLEALQTLIDDHRIDAGKIRFVHVGIGKMKFPAGAGYECVSTGFVPHAEAIRWMHRVHALLVVRSNASAASTRIYEHMRSGTPIVGVSPAGEVTRLLHETRTGEAFEPSDRKGIAGYLLRLYDRWQKGDVQSAADLQRIESFSRRSQAMRLASLLDDVRSARLE
jgi:glycosyltransferase involved in cell wall biosynthesis